METDRGGGQGKTTRLQSTKDPEKAQLGAPAQKALGTQIQRPLGRWWTLRSRDTPGLLKGTQRSGAGPGTRDADPSQARPSGPAGPYGPTHTAPFRKPLSTANAAW